ncbi:MAG: hypothetical protein A2452_01340 [Candidatus Firestonebacteria bacterium RIFOXYC2_FULL_39_67]|nr:MAG: hypothetical protein A2536_06080 [Candidatus Firestonebacteria bacterium RIFOXYD2_FULL_39_29]OGF52785.1 MAG: hypothetical protein A2497_01170 [Candidatus Firestonebacteria bacterium RifOxyC12_full_39_7]OGF54879.1 MAG: hypothetical protein A2452_01340 [Candidatus Firestonebacteria bacterium RIFOXYC2_FULL_39_67]
MANEIKIAVIGLDTSHSIEFTKRMQAPDCPADMKVDGLRVMTCLAFVTPFQNEEGINTRIKQLEAWGVKITSTLEETVKGADAVMIEIDDPSLHLEYFKKCSELGLPIYLDKPMADTYVNAKIIYDISKKNNIKICSMSSLRFPPALNEAINKVPKPDFSYFFGPLGIPPAGSSIVWYGVHTFEMLVRAMGRGALSVHTKKHSNGVVIVVEYPDKKVAIADLIERCFQYGGTLRDKGGSIAPFVVDKKIIYTDLVRELFGFLKGGPVPVPFEDTLEVMALLDTAEKSLQSGKTEKVPNNI